MNGKTILIIAIAACMLCVSCTAAAQSDDPDYQKIIEITLGYEGSAYHVVSEEMLYGAAPNLYISSGSLKGVILDRSGGEVRSFYLQDPNVAFSDPPRPAGSVAATGTVTGSSLTVTLPYLEAGKIFQLYDRQTGALLATADLTSPVTTFCADYPADPDCLLLGSGSASGAAAAEPAAAPIWMYAATLLIAAVVAASGAATVLIIRTKKAQPAKPVVLVVDDDPSITDLLRTLLNYKGYTALTAGGGQECLDSIRKQIPDVILLDIMMAPMDGWTTLQRIRADPKTKSIPVLMITAKPLAPEDVLQYHVCIDDYIVKPFSNDELFTAVAHILERKKRIVEDLARVKKAGITQETYCELQKLSKRVDVDNKLLRLLQQRYESPVVASTTLPEGGKFRAAVDCLVTSTHTSEARLEDLRRQINAACLAKGCPAPDW